MYGIRRILREKYGTMTEELQFIPFTSPADRGWAEAMEIYRRSFPYKEQRSEEDHVRAPPGSALPGRRHLVRRRVRRHPLPLAGRRMALCRTPRRIARPARPEHGFEGPRGLLRRPARHSGDRPSGGRNLDPGGCTSTGRLGFVENPHEYIHPSFRRPFEQHRLVLMSYPSPLTDDEARRFADFVRETVLRYTEHEAPQLPRLP